MEDTDQQLISLYIEKDDLSAFELLIKRYTKIIYNFTLRLCRNREEAEDITQETFLKVWKNIKKYDAQFGFKVWLFTIARRTTIDYLRKRKNIFFSQLDTEEFEFADSLPDLAPLPDEVFSNQELSKTLERAMDKISLEHRTIIFLHHNDGMTFDEISNVLNKPMNTIKSQYRRAMLKLREHLVHAPK